MSKHEIIQKIAAYCNKGLLNGLRVYTCYNGCAYCAENIHIEGDSVYFDQAWGDGYCRTSSHCDFYDHVKEYVLGVLAKIEELIKIDRNLF
jgi:hypothetical protein